MILVSSSLWQQGQKCLSHSLNHLFLSHISGFDHITQVSIFLGIVCTVIMGVSHWDGDFVLKLLNMIWYLTFTTGGPMHPHGKEVLKQMPQEICNLLSKFDLESHTVIYAVCPTYDCTFKPQFPDGPDSPTYPSMCTNVPYPGAGISGQQLLHGTVDHDNSDNELKSRKPIKPFIYHHFHNYLTNLLPCKDLEFMMDKWCDNVMSTINQEPPEFAQDVWDAEFIRSFKGPNSCWLFVDRGNEGWYLFAINIDFFNVEGMCIQGASNSCGLISKVLDRGIQYKPENMYIGGIIPGPCEPCLTRINLLIRPMITHFCESWERGVLQSHCYTLKWEGDMQCFSSSCDGLEGSQRHHRPQPEQS